MNSNLSKQLKKHFVKQQDQSDCGVACLQMILSFFGGKETFDRLRELSGTQQTGTTMLGLVQAAKEVKLDVQAYRGNVEELKKIEFPALLHITKKGSLNHYVVVFAYQNSQFFVADPAEGIIQISADELGKVWISKALLLIKKSPEFESKKNKEYHTWYWLKQQLSADSNRLLLTFILGLVIALLSLVISLFTQQLVDKILPEKKVNLFLIGLFITFLLLLFQNGLTYLRTRFIVEQSRDFNSRVVNWFIEKLMQLPQVYFDTRTTGDFVSRLQDTSKLQRVVSYVVGELGISLLVLLSTLGAIFLYSTQLGFFVLTWIPVLSTSVIYFKNDLLRLQRGVLTSYAHSETQFIDVIQGMDLIKSTSTQQLFRKVTALAYAGFQESRLKLGLKGGVFSAFSGVLVLMGTIIVIGFGGYSVFSASIQLGVFIAVMQLSSQSFQAAQQLFLSVIQLQEAKAVYDRMIEFTNIEHKDDETSQTNVESSYLPEKLFIKNLSHRFNGRKPTFEQVSFTIEKGQITVLMGDSGSGKSTLVRILDKLYPFDSGEIYLEPNQFVFSNLSESSWRKLTSVVHQTERLFSGTVLQNILMSEDVSVIQERLQYCSRFGFDALFSKFPQGYLTQVGKEGIQLSGGQRQLVSFARAVICNKPILLLDEPTTAMDKHMRLFVFDLLQRLKKDKVILIVTHLDSVAQLADNLVSMDEFVR